MSWLDGTIHWRALLGLSCTPGLVSMSASAFCS